MAKKGYLPRLNKRIQNLSRAVNKIDPRIKNKLLFAEHRIEDIEPGINSIKYSKDGVRQEIRYDELENLSQKEQGSLYASLTVDRYNLRQEKALELLQTKGKISWQFKKSLKEDNPVLLKSIEEFEEQAPKKRTKKVNKTQIKKLMNNYGENEEFWKDATVEEIEALDPLFFEGYGESDIEAIKAEFEFIQFDTEGWEQESAEFFEYKPGQEYRLYDFYRPDQSGGFTELNQFTWNAYKMLREDQFGSVN